MVDFVGPKDEKGNAHAAENADMRSDLFKGSSHTHKTSLDITKSDRLTSKAWADELEEAKHKPWNTTVAGRGMIRLFSRGVMGATFFALGSRIARNGLEHYNQFEKPGTFNLPQQIAYHVDKFIGRPLARAAEALGHDGKKFVTFRPTTIHKNSAGIHEGVSLGHELVNLTFDFATMSIGDAMGRDIANALDPGVKHNWVDNKGHLDYTQIAKNVGYNTWKYLSYNQGEDWAVALPYTFFVRWQRNLIDKISPGFGYDNDRKLNGGSFKVDDHGKVVGTYGLEGALDLQSRFTVYNIGTVMFREAYVAAGHALKDWYQSGFKLPHLPSNLTDASNSITGAVRDTMRWAARDAVKATLYMTPAMPAFWLFRTPQTKYRGVFIHPEKGGIAYRTGAGHYDVDFVHPHEFRRSTNVFKNRPFDGYNPTFFSNHDGSRWHRGEAVANPITPYMDALRSDGKPLQQFPAYDKTYGVFDALTNPLGRINNAARKMGHWPIGKLKEKYNVEINTPQTRAKRTTDQIINASFAYTPYFFMKSDVMAVAWDNAKMDMAIERAIDGVTHLNAGEVKAGVGEIWNTMWHKPFDDPEREIKAQQSICNDKSPPDGQMKQANQRCLEDAMQDIALHSQYHRETDTRKFVERLQDSKKRSHSMLDSFRKDEAKRFTDTVTPHHMPHDASGFAMRERIRQAQERDDFPDIGTTVH